MNIAAAANREVTRHAWRPLFWEPVSGTGERLMVGVLHAYGGEVKGVRIIRDDVLDGLYGIHAANSARTLIDTALGMYAKVAKLSGVAAADMPLLGLYPGPLRATGDESSTGLIRTAALLYSSLVNLDKIDDLYEADAPQSEEVNRRFSTEVRQHVERQRPELVTYFGKGTPLVDGGQAVRFGYFSPMAVVHFSVLHPVRQSASVRDARARLWELQCAKQISGVQRAALITAVPRLDDATLGERQRNNAKANEREIEREADASSIRLNPVHTAEEGAMRLIALAS